MGDGQWVVHNCAQPRVPPPNLPESGPLRELWDSGYNLSDHFITRWNEGRGKGLTTQDVVDLLQGPGHYKELNGQYWGVFNRVGGKALTV